MSALTWITTEAKKIRRAHPRKHKTWIQYVKEASNRYARKNRTKGKRKTPRKLGRPVPAALPKYGPPKVAGVRTTSRTHTDKNKITANIQVGKAGLGTLTAEIRRRKLEKVNYLVLRRYHEKTKRGRSKLTKEIAALNREINKLK